jgi:hypothetical protein
MGKLVLERGPESIGRNDGTVEHRVFAHDPDDPTVAAENLVHLSVTKSGHASVIDYDAHPHCKVDHPPEVVAAKAKRFLELDGHLWLGHPSNPQARAAEVAKLKARHKLT